MTQGEYEEILGYLRGMRRAVEQLYDRRTANIPNLQSPFQGVSQWTTNDYPYVADRAEIRLSVLFDVFNDCYLRHLYLICVPGYPQCLVSGGQLITSINNTAQMVADIENADDYRLRPTLRNQQLQPNASTSDIIQMAQKLFMNLDTQSRYMRTLLSTKN